MSVVTDEETTKPAAKPGPPDTRQPYPVGHVREGFEELWGWAEVMKASDRTDTALRYVRGRYADEFPEPVAVLHNGPVYLREEVEAFIRKYPKRKTDNLPDYTIREIQRLGDSGISAQHIAQTYKLGLSTVYKWLALPRV